MTFQGEALRLPPVELGGLQVFKMMAELKEHLVLDEGSNLHWVSEQVIWNPGMPLCFYIFSSFLIDNGNFFIQLLTFILNIFAGVLLHFLDHIYENFS